MVDDPMKAHDSRIHCCIGEANRVEILFAQGDINVQAKLDTVIQSGGFAASVVGQRLLAVGVGASGAVTWISVMGARVVVASIVISMRPPHNARCPRCSAHMSPRQSKVGMGHRVEPPHIERDPSDRGEPPHAGCDPKWHPWQGIWGGLTDWRRPEGRTWGPGHP
jgi:hypothetical protein